MHLKIWKLISAVAWSCSNQARYEALLPKIRVQISIIYQEFNCVAPAPNKKIIHILCSVGTPHGQMKKPIKAMASSYM